MEDGEELQMFVVRIVLWIRQRCFHREDITTITPKGLVKSQSRPLAFRNAPCPGSAMDQRDHCQSCSCGPTFRWHVPRDSSTGTVRD
jgi:hypothetical protein